MAVLKSCCLTPWLSNFLNTLQGFLCRLDPVPLSESLITINSRGLLSPKVSRRGMPKQSTNPVFYVNTMLGANLSDQIPGGPNPTLTLTLNSEPPQRGRKKWCRAKMVEKCRKTFLTLFDDFLTFFFLPCSKIVEKCRKTF